MLDLEREVETTKEKTSSESLKQLTNLYSEAIEYFGFLDDQVKCSELQMRYQSILVRPYVLDCLARIESEEAARQKLNPKPQIQLKATKKWLESQERRKSS